MGSLSNRNGDRMTNPSRGRPILNKRWINESRIHFTDEEFRRIVTYQKFLCPICKADVSGKRGGERGVWDHQHPPSPTRYIRGSLCYTCNESLGKYERGVENAFKDDHLYLWAEEYLHNPPCFALGIYREYQYPDCIV